MAAAPDFRGAALELLNLKARGIDPFFTAEPKRYWARGQAWIPQAAKLVQLATAASFDDAAINGLRQGIDQIAARTNRLVADNGYATSSTSTIVTVVAPWALLGRLFYPGIRDGSGVLNDPVESAIEGFAGSIGQDMVKFGDACRAIIEKINKVLQGLLGGIGDVAPTIGKLLPFVLLGVLVVVLISWGRRPV